MAHGIVCSAYGVMKGYDAQGVCKERHPFVLFDCTQQTAQPRALFRGMSPPLVGGAFETGINYAVYSSVLRYLSQVCACGMCVRYDAPQHEDAATT